MKVIKNILEKKNVKIFLVIFLIVGGVIYKFFDSEKVVEGYESDNPEIKYDYNLENYIVEIKGEVNKPGLYIVMKDSRIGDIIDLAQGFTNNADTEKVNLASKITDGMLIIIDKINDTEANNKISINKATLEELQKIPNIGKSKATNIIKYREENGAFIKLEDLINVNGISENLFEQIKEYICL